MTCLTIYNLKYNIKVLLSTIRLCPIHHLWYVITPFLFIFEFIFSCDNYYHTPVSLCTITSLISYLWQSVATTVIEDWWIFQALFLRASYDIKQYYICLAMRDFGILRLLCTHNCYGFTIRERQTGKGRNDQMKTWSKQLFSKEIS